MAENEQFTRVFKTQLDAVEFLKERGFKISKSTLGRDLHAGKISTDANGYFEENSLLAYAVAMRDPAVTVANKALTSASADRLAADAELKKYQAERQRLKLEKEKGQLMPVADFERNLAARALFFKNEVRNYIRLHGAAIIHLVGGNEQQLPELVRHWEDSTAVWMGAWAEEREFCTTLDDVEETPAGEDSPPAGEEEGE